MKGFYKKNEYLVNMIILLWLLQFMFTAAAVSELRYAIFIVLIFMVFGVRHVVLKQLKVLNVEKIRSYLLFIVWLPTVSFFVAAISCVAAVFWNLAEGENIANLPEGRVARVLEESLKDDKLVSFGVKGAIGLFVVFFIVSAIMQFYLAFKKASPVDD